MMVIKLGDLLMRIKAFSERWHRNSNELFSLSISHVRKANRSSTSINNAFLFSQLLANLLLRMKPLATDREDFCAHCVKVYQERYGHEENEAHLEKMLQQVAKFQVDIYSNDTVLRWYTKNAFLYEIVNNSLRTDDVETIFHSRFIIREIYQQLQKRQLESSIRVYRGQRMLNAEAELLSESIGKLVSMKSFLSTSLDRQVAEIFAGIKSGSTDEGIAFVIFIIDAVPTESNKMLRPFGDISDISYFDNAEKEILFMVGSVFRITNVAQDFNRRWIISMTMCDQEDIELNKLFTWLKDRQHTYETDDDPYHDFGALLLAMNMPKQVEKFYHHLLREYSLFPSTNTELAKCYHMLGKAALTSGLAQSSNSWWEVPPDLEKVRHGGHHESEQNERSFACIPCSRLKFFKNWRYSRTTSSPIQSREPSYFDKSLECFQKALLYIGIADPNYHFLAGSIHHSTANAYRALFDFKRASACYEKALLHYRRSVGKKHRLIVEVHVDFGRMYYEKKCLRKALDYYLHALNLAQEILPETHPEMGVFHMSLAVVYADMGKKNRALFHINAAANMNFTSFPDGNPPLSSYYAAIDIFYAHKETMDAFLAQKDNIHHISTTQAPVVKQSRSNRTGVIYYRCPWCHLYVWIYKPFAFCKGSPCFQCLSRMFTLRPPRVNLSIAQYLEYLVAYEFPIQHSDVSSQLARQLRHNYLESLTQGNLTS